jgi:hypothetical protein
MLSRSSRLFIWLLRVGHKCIYMYVRAAVLVSSFFLRPTIRSFTHTRSDNKNRSFYGGWSNYIYIYVCISTLSLFFSSFLFMTGSICGWRMRLSVRTELVHHHWTEQTHTSFFSFLNLLYKCPTVSELDFSCILF